MILMFSRLMQVFERVSFGSSGPGAIPKPSMNQKDYLPLNRQASENQLMLARNLEQKPKERELALKS